MTTHWLERQKFKTLTTSNDSKAMKQQKLLFIVGGNAKYGTATSEDSLVVPYKTKYTHRTIQQSCSLVFTQRGWKLVQMFREAVFIITKIWRQQRSPSVGEWVNKLVYPDSRILFSD